MSFSLSYIAFKGHDKVSTLSALKLRKSETCSDTCAHEHDFIGAELPNGWYLVIDNSSRLWEQDNLEQVSMDTELFACCINEQTTYSKASEWRHGDLVWSVENNFEDNFDAPLTICGFPPTQLAELKESVDAGLDDIVDEDERVANYVDIPIQLFSNAVGYSYYGEQSFLDLEEILERTV
jgi:hypothetical protein